MTHRSVVYELVIDLSDNKWGVACPIDQSLIGPVQYGWDRFQKDPNSMTFGGGLLAGSPLPGTRRMIFCGYSPQWEGFYVSALGGAMYVFHRVGVNYVWIRGQADTDCVIIINHKNGEYDIQFDPVDTDSLWKGYTDENQQTWIGYYALQHALYEKYRSLFSGDWFRIISTGPASRYTKEGAIGSNAIRNGSVSDIDDWAGRGGLGSRLLQYHHVAAIVFGGDWEDPALKEAKELDEYFLAHFGKRAIAADLALSQKYRYVPEFETGGTFGVNMHTADDRLFSFNYQSVLESDDRRLEQHTNFILAHYLKQFNQETIQTKSFLHCGEPCAIVCKKYRAEYKKDYEPYQALGPNCGIFDQRAAEKLNKWVDSMGWDAIQAGGTISWIMEIIFRGLIDPVSFGLSNMPLSFHFSSTPGDMDIIEDSAYHADYAIAIGEMILFSPKGEPFRQGMRSAAKWLDSTYGINSMDYAVYTAHGVTGCMVPNQYWVPGMFSPMPIMGKYFSYYGNDFLPPYQLGRKNVERFVYELYSENSGSCRFHRKWVEDIIDDIILSHFDLSFNYWQVNFDLARSIHNTQSSSSHPWEGKRIIAIIQRYLEKWKQDGLEDSQLDAWIEKFQENPQQAAIEYWNDLMQGMMDAFQEGFDEPVHEEHGHLK